MAMKLRTGFACLLFSFACTYGAFASTSNVKACLTELCVGGNQVKERLVVSKLGGGVRVHRPDDTGWSRCYSDSDAGPWADFIFAGQEESSIEGSLRGIMLTEEKICEVRKGSPTRSLGRNLAGASLGMTENQVIASLGKPSRIDDAKEREARKPSMKETRYASKFGDRVLVYDRPDELGFTFIYLKDGRVRTIWFSEGE